jgi:hypothetical protein
MIIRFAGPPGQPRPLLRATKPALFTPSEFSDAFKIGLSNEKHNVTRVSNLFISVDVARRVFLFPLPNVQLTKTFFFFFCVFFGCRFTVGRQLA